MKTEGAIFLLFLRTAFFPGGPCPPHPPWLASLWPSYVHTHQGSRYSFAHGLLAWGASPLDPPWLASLGPWYAHTYQDSRFLRNLPSSFLGAQSPQSPRGSLSLRPWCAHTYKGTRYPFVPSSFLRGQPPRPPVARFARAMVCPYLPGQLIFLRPVFFPGGLVPQTPRGSLRTGGLSPKRKAMRRKYDDLLTGPSEQDVQGSLGAAPVTARRAKRENGGLREDPSGCTITYLQVFRTWPSDESLYTSRTNIP
jgi:hypothetical protein